MQKSDSAPKKLYIPASTKFCVLFLMILKISAIFCKSFAKKSQARQILWLKYNAVLFFVVFGIKKRQARTLSFISLPNHTIETIGSVGSLFLHWVY